MRNSEKIEIRELYEFQLYERNWWGRTKPVGPIRKSLDKNGQFNGEDYDLQPTKRYAFKRRRVEIDPGGYGHPGEWSGFSSWKRPF